MFYLYILMYFQCTRGNTKQRNEEIQFTELVSNQGQTPFLCFTFDEGTDYPLKNSGQKRNDLALNVK